MSDAPVEKPQITFILPCAGSGTRLGFAGHKELFPISSDRKLIDFSLDHIKIAAKWIRKCAPLWSIKVVSVIRPWKSEVADYIKVQLPDVPVNSVTFNDTLFEWPGSVHSAERFYSHYNIVLLPDSRLALSHEHPCFDGWGQPLIAKIIASLDKKPLVFGYLPCARGENRLGQLGAIEVDLFHEEIIQFQDKPGRDLDRFNGFWCCYGFTANIGAELYEFLAGSVAKKPISISSTTFQPAGAFAVADYRDFGTPEAISEFRSSSKV